MPPAHRDAALEVTGLDAGYEGAQVLRGVSLTARAGEVTALFGSNGAGKTTLLRVVSGFLPATAGSVVLFGEDVTRAAPHRRFANGLCYVPEGRGVFRSLTVRENLMMQAPNRTGRDVVDETVAAFPVLSPRIKQIAGTMSGGEQQMLALAVAYLRNPRLVLVDEVSMGLAPVVVSRIYEHLCALTEQGTGLLLVDQFVTRALTMTSAAYVLRRGEIVFAGKGSDLTYDELFARYSGP